MASDDNKREAILMEDYEPYTIADGVHLVPTQGNGLVVETGTGVVLVDGGPGGPVTQRMIRDVGAISPQPLRAIIYSHGHLGYNSGVDEWQAAQAAAGRPPAELIAHRNCLARYDRYRRTHDLQLWLASWQFPRATRSALEGSLTLTDPTVVFDDEYLLDDPERPVVARWSPSETDDSVAVWLPEQRILWGGPTTINGFPNIGTPFRTVRLTQRWIDSLERLIALDAEILVPEFGPITSGAAAVRERLVTTADALRWLVDETTDRMNRGLSDVEIIHDLDYPDHWADHDYLSPNYGHPDYVVRDLYREQNGWWTSRNITDLHPAAPDDAAAAVLSAVDPDTVLDRARDLMAAGEHQLALHVLDLLAGAPGDDPALLEARRLKGDCAEQLARSCPTYVSRSLYFGAATLHRAGLRRASEAPDGPGSIG
ncbi:MAG: alkyl sulfatase dimerization domain-containing protein [Acidimicrobiales bacterium]